MQHTTRIRAAFARYLLANENEELRRRLGILRETPYPPGSYSVAASDEWAGLEELVEQKAFIYGGTDNAVVFTYESQANRVTVLFGILKGVIVGTEGSL